MPNSSSISKGLEDKIASLVIQLATSNQTMLTIAQEVQQHNTLFYGSNTEGGLITERNVAKQMLKEHEEALKRLEDTCDRITGFMDRQVEINKSESDSLHVMNRVIILLAGALFLLLLLVGAADLHNLQLILGQLSLP